MGDMDDGFVEENPRWVSAEQRKSLRKSVADLAGATADFMKGRTGPSTRKASRAELEDGLTVNELVNMSQSFEDADAAGVDVLITESLLFDVVRAYLRDDVFARRFVECMEIIRRKNADYSQGEQKQDRIAAFKRIARDIEVPVRKAWAVFAQKHWGAVMRYIKDGYVDSEPIGGRINDMINYLVLLGAIVDWESDSLRIGGDQ